MAESSANLRYLPSTTKLPNSIGLALSGGGFRATLFHLGAIRRLNEFGVLSRVTTLSSVSGGSIVNGFLASRLQTLLSGGISDFEATVSQPMREFCSLNIRRWPALERFVPWMDNSAQLAQQYDRHLTGAKFLKDIPSAPLHIFCATDLAYGVNWMFKKVQCGDYQAGFQNTPEDLKLSTAVAASSCFPPVFKPMNLGLDPARFSDGKATPGKIRDATIRGMTLSDGGVYDNLGLEPVWKDHEFVLSSDGGGLFPTGSDTGFASEIGRYIAIPENQALAVRKRWLISSFLTNKLKGTYWGIGSSAYEYGVNQGYSEELAKSCIASIRTDLDSFSKVEAAVLENHGYWLADAAIRIHLPELITGAVPELKIPHPEWAGPEDKISQALQDSSKRTLLGRS